jgi:hypothetical protein
MIPFKKLFSLAICFLVVTCTIHEPKLPEWDTEWSVHIPSQNFVMDEIINDSTLIAGTDSEGQPIILISVKDSTDWQRITSADLSFDPQNDDFHSEIGDITLGDYDDLISDSLTVRDVLPAELFSLGDTLPPYDSMTVIPPTVLLEYEDYRSALIKEGNMWLTFHNEMFLDIREGLIIEVYTENGEMEYVDRALFSEPIPSGTVVTSELINLENKKIYNKFRLRYIIPLYGSDTPQVLTEDQASSFFYTVLSVDEFIVSEGEAKIPEQSFDDSDAIDISDEDHKIIHARIERGNIRFAIQNRLPLDSNIQLELPNFIRNNQPLIINHRLLSQQDDLLNINLSGYEITNHTNPGSVIEAIDYFAIATVDSTSDFVLVRSTDSILIQVDTDTFYLSSFVGELDTVEVDIDRERIDDIDLLDDVDGQLRLNDLVMRLDFYNEIDLPIQVDLHISGYRRNKSTQVVDDSVIIFISEQLLPNRIAPMTTIVLDEQYSNPSIVDLLEILPNEIEFSGNAKIYGQGGVSINDGLRLVYHLESPLNFQISNPIFYSAAVDSITDDDLSEDQRDQIVNDVSNVSAQFTLTNGTPLGFSVKYYLATDSLLLFDEAIVDSSQKIIFQAQVNPGNTGANGYVDTPVQSHVPIALTEKQLNIFNYSPLYTRQEFIITPTEGLVKVRQSDQLTVDAVLKVKILVNSKSDKD